MPSFSRQNLTYYVGNQSVDVASRKCKQKWLDDILTFLGVVFVLIFTTIFISVSDGLAIRYNDDFIFEWTIEWITLSLKTICYLTCGLTTGFLIASVNHPSIFHKQSIKTSVFLVFLFVIIYVVIVIPMTFGYHKQQSDIRKYLIFDDNSWMCQYWINCEYITWLNIMLYVGFLSIMPLLFYGLHIILNHLLDRYQSPSRDSIEQVLNVPLVKLEYDARNMSISDVSDACASAVGSVRSVDFGPNADCWLCLPYLLIYSAFIVLYAIEQNLNSDIFSEHHSIAFTQFLFVMMVCKWVLKQFGTLCDNLKSMQYEIRGNMNNNNHNNNNNDNPLKLISIEYIMEWKLSMFYWAWVRYFFSYYSPSTEEFIILLFYHFVSELIETNVKFTDFYFKWRTKMVDYLKNKFKPQLTMHKKTTRTKRGMNQKDFSVIGWYIQVYTHNFDFVSKTEALKDSHINIWRRRLSMDITARFAASIVTSVAMIVLFVVAGQRWWNQSFGHNSYEKGLEYLGIFASLEVIHYIITIILAHRIYSVSILKVFRDFINHLARNLHAAFVFYVVCCLSIIVAIAFD